ncbi:MAG: GNAT family N-acetyltransferase [Bdellovibrionaceae bacterium]|jgi:ribosomal protein S18 acetylase RimI-like enzyme|nr:GNAT family N-acetyltransferase [Pseudobdellovibrionaceae bacterium]
MQILSLSAQHISQILKIFEDLACSYEYPLGSQWGKSSLEQHFASLGGCGLFKQDELCAFILHQRISEDLIEILYLATAPVEMRTGHMKKLFIYFLNQVATSSEIWLEVHAGNLGAIKFYKSQGFCESGRRSKYYKGTGDAILLKRLKS